MKRYLQSRPLMVFAIDIVESLTKKKNRSIVVINNKNRKVTRVLLVNKIEVVHVWSFTLFYW